MIWYSTNYFNQSFVTEISVSEKKYGDKTTYPVHAVILGVSHTIGEADTKDEAQEWIDRWQSAGEKFDKKTKSANQ
jgi:hypothetical protein